jgi:hypothetical protein
MDARIHMIWSIVSPPSAFLFREPSDPFGTEPFDAPSFLIGVAITGAILYGLHRRMTREERNEEKEIRREQARKKLRKHNELD